MDFEAVKAWLIRQTDRQIRVRWLLALLGIVLTPVALADGSLLIFVLVRAFGRDSTDPGMDARCFWIALGAVPVMFIINRLTRRPDEPEKYYHEAAVEDDSLVGSYVHRRKVQLRFFLWVIFTGPRLVDWVIFSFREISRLKKQDSHSCAAVLWLLLLKGKKVPYPEIQCEFDWLDLETTLSQLSWITGLLHLKNPPPGLSLTEDLRVAIRSGALMG